jgi:hypothetical protein
MQKHFGVGKELLPNTVFVIKVRRKRSEGGA